MSRSARNFALLLGGLLLAGCEAGFAFEVGDGQDGPFGPPPPPEELARIREDFNNRNLIGAATGPVIIDVNRGIVTLASEMFPELTSNGEVSAYDRPTYQNGLIEAEAIIVHDGGTVEASDSVELRARDRVIIAGTLIVGRGGVTIIARQRIQIDGTITSEGPVRLLLGDDTGTIQISGTVSSRSDLSIFGRGSVLIDGEVETTGDAGAIGGNIDVYSYGDVVVTGSGAHLYTSGDLEGAAGAISLQSESNLSVDSGAWVGGTPPDLAMPDSAPSGNIELKATNITVGDDVIVASTGANLREGGKVWMTATGRLVTGHRAQIAAGFGPDGGSVALKAGSLELGEASRIAGGSGSTQPGTVDISAVESISMYAFATIEGGAGFCTPGGSILIGVGGLLSVGEGALIVGGAGNTSINCGRGYQGGSITINARDAVGLEQAVIPGQGAEAGAVSINLVPDYSVVAPNLDVGPGGVIESITIDRGEEAISTIPRLVELVASTPSDSSVTVQLAGANQLEGPFEAWLPITSDPKDERFESFLGQRFVRYRVILEGRKFDVPVVDYFDIDLAPIGY